MRSWLRSKNKMGTRTKEPTVNLVGLSKNDYKGQPSTLCKGCGHNSIASQIIQIAYFEGDVKLASFEDAGDLLVVIGRMGAIA